MAIALLAGLLLTFLAQHAVNAFILEPSAISGHRFRVPSSKPLSCCKPLAHDGATMLSLQCQRRVMPISCDKALRTDDARMMMQRAPPKRPPSHLRRGPVALSWATAAATLTLQAVLTDQQSIDHDAASLCSLLGAIVGIPLDDIGAFSQRAALFACLWAFSMSNAFCLIPKTFPPPRSQATVPYRRPNMPQHVLNRIDYSYIVLNSLCMPGLFYHFVCLMRSWGLDFNQPPLFGIYPASISELILQSLPAAAVTTVLYFITYEFVYYHWHRAMHAVPALYTWVHKHHHQQTYPDRPAIDTLNTGCLESQLGLYMQLATLLCYDKLFGITNLPAGIWFFTIAGWLSVLEHDKFERKLPLNAFSADEHHMHHAHGRCNYSPYSTLWDRVYGTHLPFQVLPRTEQANTAANSTTGGTPSVSQLAPQTVSTALTASREPQRANIVSMSAVAPKGLNDEFEPSVEQLHILLKCADGASYGISLSPSNRVLRVVPGSAAAISGLQALDVILAVDGVSCRTPKHTHSLLSVEPSKSQMRHSIFVLRPKIPGSHGVNDPTNEVLNALVKPSWTEAEASWAELSERVWNHAHLRQPLLSRPTVTPRTSGDAELEDDHLNDLLDELLPDGGNAGLVGLGGGVAHSEAEYMPATRGGAALILATTQLALFTAISLLPFFERSAY